MSIGAAIKTALILHVLSVLLLHQIVLLKLLLLLTFLQASRFPERLEVKASVYEGIYARVEYCREEECVLNSWRNHILHALRVDHVPQGHYEVGRPAPHEGQYVHRTHP